MMKKTDRTTYVCVPNSISDEIIFALENDGIHDIRFFRGRHSEMKSVSKEERERSYDRIVKNCPSIELEKYSLDDPDQKRKFMMIMSVILVSDYDETALTDYCINVLNDPERQKKFMEYARSTVTIIQP